MIDFKIIKTNDDIKILADLAKEIWYEYWPILLKPAQIQYMVEKFQSYNAIKCQIWNEDYIYKIISINGESVGYYGVSAKDKKVWQSSESKIGNYLFLSKLYIKADYRGKKLGRQAFSDIINIAHAKNLDYIYLTVNKYNTNTIKAYEKWGFHTVEEAVTDIGQGFIMDDYIMRYKIV